MGESEVRAALGKQGVSVGVSSPEELAREAKAKYESLPGWSRRRTSRATRQAAAA